MSDPQDDAYSEEIERLKAEWHGEIERSKLYAKGQDLIVEIRNAEIKVLKALITELADEIEWLADKVRGYGPNRALLQRAREATR